MTQKALINPVKGFCSRNSLASTQDEQDPARLRKIIGSLQADNARMARMLSKAQTENERLVRDMQRMRADNARMTRELAKAGVPVPVDVLKSSAKSSHRASPGPSPRIGSAGSGPRVAPKRLEEELKEVNECKGRLMSTVSALQVWGSSEGRCVCGRREGAGEEDQAGSGGGGDKEASLGLRAGVPTKSHGPASKRLQMKVMQTAVVLAQQKRGRGGRARACACVHACVRVEGREGGTGNRLRDECTVALSSS